MVGIGRAGVGREKAEHSILGFRPKMAILPDAGRTWIVGENIPMSQTSLTYLDTVRRSKSHFLRLVRPTLISHDDS